MPFLTDKEITSRKESQDNLVNRLEIHKIKHGRSHGDHGKLPDVIRKAAVSLNLDGIDQRTVADMLDLNQGQVSFLKNGKNSDGSHSLKQQAIVKEIRGEREDAESKAISVMLESLLVLKPQLADVTKPKVLSTIAKDMAVISEKMRAREDRNDLGNSQVHLHLYTPRQKEMSEYEIIESPIS